MSSTSATAFLEALDRDEALRREWQAAMDAAMQDATVRFAVGRGYTLTAQDLMAVLEEREHRLSDADLARVAGGLNPQPEPPAPANLLLNNLLRHADIGPTIVPR